MGLVVEMAVVPRPEACFIEPVCKKPYLAGIIARSNHLHSQKTGGHVDQMGAIDESVLDLIRHSVRDSKPTQHDEFGAGWLCRGARCTIHNALLQISGRCPLEGRNVVEAFWTVIIVANPR